MSTYYHILGVSTDATEVQIRRAYRKLALKLNPAKNENNRQAAAKKFEEVQVAYHNLSNKNRRSTYDKGLKSKTLNLQKTDKVVKPTSSPKPCSSSKQTTERNNTKKTSNKPSNNPSNSKPKPKQNVQLQNSYPPKARSNPSVRSLSSSSDDGSGIFQDLKAHRFEELITEFYKGSKKYQEYRRRLEEKAWNRNFYGDYYNMVNHRCCLNINSRPLTAIEPKPPKPEESVPNVVAQPAQKSPEQKSKKSSSQKSHNSRTTTVSRK